MPSTPTSAWTLTDNLSGPEWPIQTPAGSSGDYQLMFLGAAIHAGSTTPVVGGWLPLQGVSALVIELAGHWYYRVLSAATGTGNAVVIWSGVGAQGIAYTINISDAQLDQTILPAVDQSYPQSKTLGSINCTGGGLRIEALLLREYRTATNGTGTVASNESYTNGASGGMGLAVRYQSVGSTGSVAGTLWTYVNPLGQAILDSQSIGFVISLKPNTPTSSNPTLSGQGYMDEVTAADPPATPTTAPTVAVVNSSTVNVTVSGWDGTADTVIIMKTEVIGGIDQTSALARSVPVTGIAMPIQITGLTVGGSYKFWWYVSREGIGSPAGSPLSALVALPGLYIRLLVDASARSVTGVDAQAWLAGASGALAGTEINHANNLAFDAALSGGQAQLRIPIGNYAGPLTVGQNVVAVARKVTGSDEIWTRIAPATVVQS